MLRFIFLCLLQELWHLHNSALCSPIGMKLFQEGHVYYTEHETLRNSGQNFGYCPSSCSPLKCTDGNPLLRFGHCLTFEEGKGVYSTRCPYSQLDGHMTSKRLGYITLPRNISELNDYMCKRMNRRGFVCKDCIDGYGPSVTSVGYKCSNCTNAWYGIPLYIIMEVLPITFFCAVIFILPIRLTSAPMTCYIMYSQMIVLELVVLRKLPVDLLSPTNPLFKITLFLYGIWNLDFFRYILPPFCVSSNLQLIHVALLDYISIITPFFLIVFSWVCIEIHGRNFQPLVYLWKPFHMCLVNVRKVWNGKADIIDVFATFLLLSYSKLVFQSYMFLDCTSLCSNAENGRSKRVLMMNVDVPCWSTQHILYLVPMAITAFILNVLPIILLLCYPVKIFRRCLTKCKANGLFLVTFIERFQGCYRDGLDGGKDLRGFSALHLLLRYLPATSTELHVLKAFHVVHWQYRAFLFLSAALLVACVRPYKDMHRNILDTLLLAHTSVICQLLTREWFPGAEEQILLIGLIPAIVFALILILKLCYKLTNRRALTQITRERCFMKLKCCQTESNVSNFDSDDDESNHPTSSIIESFTTYGTIANN